MFTASITIWSLCHNQTDWKPKHTNAFFHFVFASDIYLIRQAIINPLNFNIVICVSQLCESNKIVAFLCPFSAWICYVCFHDVCIWPDCLLTIKETNHFLNRIIVGFFFALEPSLGCTGKCIRHFTEKHTYPFANT